MFAKFYLLSVVIQTTIFDYLVFIQIFHITKKAQEITVKHSFSQTFISSWHSETYKISL